MGVVGMHTGAATMENNMEFPQKTKNRTTTWSFNPSPGHTTRGNSNSKKYTHLNVLSSTIYSEQDLETIYMSISRWMNKEDMMYVYTMEYYSTIKNNEIMSFRATWVET